MKIESRLNTAEAPEAIRIWPPQPSEHIDGVSVSDILEAPEEEGGLFTVRTVCDPAPRPADYARIVEAIIALRYTTGEEIALNRKPDGDPEKTAYLAFVAEAKAAAGDYLGVR